MKDNTIYRVTYGEDDYYEVHSYFTTLESALAEMHTLALEMKEDGEPEYRYTWFRVEALTFDSDGVGSGFFTHTECADAFPEL